MLIFFHHFQRSSRGPARTTGLVRSGGFTLIELLVVISIMLIFTTVLLLRQQTFDSTTLLRSLGYSVALSVRQAQVYGSSIRENATNAFTTNTAARSYGVHFEKASSVFLLFADADNSGTYNTGDQIVQTFQIAQGYSITTFCTVGGTNGVQVFCSSGPSCPTAYSSAPFDCTPSALTSLDVLFTRPNPEACFTTNLETLSPPCVSGGDQVYTTAYIQLIGPDGAKTRGVTISQTGQIAVGALNS